MSMSESITELAKALAMAQSEIKGAAKDSTNPHFKTKYADLASVWDACREPLTKNGLSVAQSTRMEGNAVVVITMLLHSSGEYIRGEISLPPTKPDPQGHGSAITYARRYALAAMVGIAPEDDDGVGASAPANPDTNSKRDGASSATPQAAAGKGSPEAWTAAYVAGLTPLESMAALNVYTAKHSDALVRLDKVSPDLRDRIELAIAEARHRIENANPFGEQ